ncbi:MAG: TolC family protein [Thermodesulfobacteriota bacterium]
MTGLLIGLVLLCDHAGAVDLSSLQTLSLSDAQAVALDGNPSLQAAAERVEQARQRVIQAKGAYFPSVDTSGSYIASQLSESGSASQEALADMTGTSFDRSSEVYGVSLGASWSLFEGFSRRFNRLRVEYGEEELLAAERDAGRLLLQAVAESFYGVQLARYNIIIGEANKAFNSQLLSEAEAAHGAGAGSLSVVLNFKVQMNSAETDLLLARKNQEIARLGLALLMGVESGQLPPSLRLAELAMVEEDSFAPLGTETLVEEALARRPDLQRQEMALAVAESSEGGAKGVFYPRLGLKGSLDGRRNDDMAFEGEDFGSTLSLNLSYNLYRGGSDRARLAETRSRKREQQRTLENKKNQVRTEVMQAAARLHQAREQFILQKKSEVLVRQTRDLVQKGYAAGQESLVRLNEVQRDLVSTQSRLALALVALHTNRHALDSAIGTSRDGEDDQSR